MFSPQGTKKIMVANHNASRAAGIPLAEVIKKNMKEENKRRADDMNRSQLSTDSGVFSNSLSNKNSLMSSGTGKTFTEEDIRNILTQTTDIGMAIKKLAYSAFRFRRDKDHTMLKPFETDSITYTDFKNILKRLYQIEYSRNEFFEICKFLDGNGTSGIIECSKFVFLYLVLGHISKSDHRSKVIQKSIEIQKIEQEKKIKILENEERKLHECVDYNFTEEDRLNALEKIRISAMKYDRNHPTAMSLDSFNVEYLKPETFKNLLKIIFKTRVSSKELGALITQFDTEKNKHVDSPYFLSYFLKIGINERMKARTLQIQSLSEMKIKEEKHEEILRNSNNISINMLDSNFSDVDLTNAIQKLQIASLQYDSGRRITPLRLKSFEGSYLSYNEFYDAIHKNFHIILTKKELSALINMFDPIRDGKINCKEFLTKFIKLSTELKIKNTNVRMLKGQQQQEQQQKQQRDQSPSTSTSPNRNNSNNNLNSNNPQRNRELDMNFTQDHLQSSLTKIAEAARDYNPGDKSSSGLGAFSVGIMTPGEFKVMLKRFLNIDLSRKELGALVSILDTNGNGVINCEEFLLRFTLLGTAERKKLKNELKEKQIQEENEKRMKIHKKSEEDKKNSEKLTDFQYTQEEFESAMLKLRSAAEKCNKDRKLLCVLSDIDSLNLSAFDFRDIMKKYFNIMFSPKELGAVINSFDKDDINMISLREFMLMFQQLLRYCRHSLINEKVENQQNKEILKRKKIEDDIKRFQFEEDFKLKFTNKDEESLLRKLREAATSYVLHTDRIVRHLRLFRGLSQPPFSFRAIFSNVFNITLDYPEIGALTQVLDPESVTTSSNLVDGNKFVKAFLKLVRYTEKALLGKVSEESLTLSLLRPDTRSHSPGPSSPSRSPSPGRRRACSSADNSSPVSRSIMSPSTTTSLDELLLLPAMDSNLPFPFSRPTSANIDSVSNTAAGSGSGASSPNRSRSLVRGGGGGVGGKHRRGRGRGKDSNNKKPLLNNKKDAGVQTTSPDSSWLALSPLSPEPLLTASRPATTTGMGQRASLSTHSVTTASASISAMSTSFPSTQSQRAQTTAGRRGQTVSVPMIAQHCGGNNPWVELETATKGKQQPSHAMKTGTGTRTGRPRSTAALSPGETRRSWRTAVDKSMTHNYTTGEERNFAQQQQQRRQYSISAGGEGGDGGGGESSFSSCWSDGDRNNFFGSHATADGNDDGNDNNVEREEIDNDIL